MASGQASPNSAGGFGARSDVNRRLRCHGAFEANAHRDAKSGLSLRPLGMNILKWVLAKNVDSGGVAMKGLGGR